MCAFSSHWLSSSASNFDFGKRELLSVKLALEKWKHLLEGTDKLVIVWTDHKNLSYIQTAKRLSSKQDHQALFFIHLDCILTYSPCSCNIEPFALSHHFAADGTISVPDTILITGKIITNLTLEIKKAIKEVN